MVAKISKLMFIEFFDLINSRYKVYRSGCGDFMIYRIPFVVNVISKAESALFVDFSNTSIV